MAFIPGSSALTVYVYKARTRLQVLDFLFGVLFSRFLLSNSVP